MNTFYILTAAAVLTLVSCKKEKNTKTEDHSHHTTATITISTPHEGDTIQGDFNVLGSISGSAALHGYQVTIKNLADYSILFEKEVHDHLENFAINEAVTHTLSSYTPVKLEVVVALDHDGNKTSKSVNFTIH